MRRHPALATGLALLLLAMPAGGAQAQTFQCRAGDARLSAPPVKPDAPARRTPISGYTLALSWSPEFCRNRQTQSSHRHQCSGAHGRFGFILHGLWPDGAGGNWPQWCRTVAPPAPATLRQHFCMMPSPGLMARQWAKHGSCMARHPEGYFKVAAILWDSFVWPDYDRISRDKALTAGAIRHAFAAANPGWRTDQIGLRLNSKGWLQEMRLCYGRDFMPARCGAAQFGPRDSVSARIWRGL